MSIIANRIKQLEKDVLPPPINTAYLGQMIEILKKMATGEIVPRVYANGIAKLPEEPDNGEVMELQRMLREYYQLT